MFNYIINPATKRKISIYGKTGKYVLKKYLFTLNGGTIQKIRKLHIKNKRKSSSPLPSPKYCKKFKKTVKPKCKYQKGCHWVTRKGCLSISGLPSPPSPINCKDYKKTIR